MAATQVAKPKSDPHFLPASPDAEIRLSYQFLPLPAPLRRVTIGAGVLAALLVIYFKPW